jgi:hypothetical protein
VPTKSIIPLTDEQIEQVSRNVVPIQGTRQLPLGNIVATIRDGAYLMPWQQYALALINEVIDDRPIYFASSGNAASELGVNNYLVRQGLAFRLNNGPLPESEIDGLLQMESSPYTSVTGEWVDVARTQTLVDDVFIHRSGLPDDWTHWPDVATIGIPNYYAWSYLALVQAAIQTSDQDALDRYQARAEAWTLLGT